MANYTTIDDASAHFQTALWSGSGGTQSITFDGNSDMQPDWVWTKGRTIAFNHALMDSSRGVGSSGKLLFSNLNNTESDINDYVMTLDSDGFGVGAGDAGFNASNDTYVSWCWRANGGTTSTNSDGDINSTVQVNSDAGFSIITDSPANNTARTIGHGLGAKPDFIIRRARNRAEDWCVYHSAFESTLPGGLQGLNTTATYNDSATTLFTSVSNTTFGVGTDFSVNGNYNYITYAFKNVQGYSKFGKYAGTENANGPFVYLGFKPAFIMIKNATVISNWRIFDNKRIGYNVANYKLLPNSTSVETTDVQIDMLSNGFKIKTSDSEINSGVTHIYMAFAENPFVTSTGIPTTAR